MQVTVEENNLVANIMLIFLAIEGVLFVSIAMLYVWHLAKRVSDQRYDMYNCFMQIPIGTVRSLATRPINLEDEEDEDEDAAENAPAEQETQNKEEEGGGAAQYGGRSFGKSFSNKVDESGDPFFEGGKEEQTEQRVKRTLLGRTMSFLSFGRYKPGKIAPTGAGKRQLQKSNYSAVWIVWPFAVWGIVVVIMNAVQWSRLTNLGADISLLNIINGVLLAHHHNFFFAQELTASGSGIATSSYSPAQSNVARLALELNDFQNEYKALLYGGTVS